MMSKSRFLTRYYSTRNPNERDKYWVMLLHRWTHGRWLVYCTSNFTNFSPTFPLAMERVTYVTKSFLIALALVKRHLTAEQASQAAHVEVSSQIQRWGEVEDSKSTALILNPRMVINSASFLGTAFTLFLLAQPRPTAHDVDFHDARRQLGSSACLVTNMT